MDRILSQTDYDAAVAADVDAGAVLLWYETVWARCEAVVDTRRRAGIDGALEEAKADAYDDAYADCYQGYYELITDQPDYDPDGAEDLAHEDADNGRTRTGYARKQPSTPGTASHGTRNGTTRRSRRPRRQTQPVLPTTSPRTSYGPRPSI